MAIEGLNPYVDIRTRTLYNELGIQNPDELKRVESAYTTQRLTELGHNPIPGRFDFDHLKAIHHHIFQDVYAWAGEPRQNFDAAKQSYVGGPAHNFIPSAKIETEAVQVFDRLRGNDNLTGLSREQFIERAALLHNDINHLHAFPEGNGRSQREFLRQLSVEAGHPIDLKGTTEERHLEAAIAGVNGDHRPMQRLLQEATDPQRVESLHKAIVHLEAHLGTDKTQSFYIATTTPGERYSGQLLDRGGDDFLFKTDKNHVMIGRVADISPAAKGLEQIEFTAGAGYSQQQSVRTPDPGLGIGF